MSKEKKSKKSLKDELALKEKEASEYKDKCLRALAEYENLKKRFAKEKEEFLRFSNEGILLQLLPIIDDFDRAHEAAKRHEHGEVFSKGVEMILNKLHQLLNQNGVEKVKTEGEKFNPHLHEALMAVESSEHPDQTVAEEVAPGYTLNGKLIRAAKVKIYHKTEKNEDKKEDNKKEK